MKCFYHTDRDAVGICKACNKGICRECAEDLGHSIACKNSCIEKAECIEHIIDNNSVTFKTHSKNVFFMPSFFGFMGAVMLVVGLQKSDLMNFSVVMGLGFIFFGVLMFFINKKWASKLKN